MKLVISVDVEEEGLFSGRYPRVPPGVKNVSQLERLEFITSEFGFPLTFLVTYPVAMDPNCLRILERWREKRKAEIGAHLHHWNTPPFHDLPYREPVKSELMPSTLLDAKLGSLMSALRNRLEVVPKSFRMGRFDFGENVRRLLPQHGLTVDSSIAPSHGISGVPEHFLASADPFRYTFKTCTDERSSILEVPVTLVPLLRDSPAKIFAIARRIPPKARKAFLAAFSLIGVVGIHPAWFPLKLMKLAALLHRSRGGQFLTMAFHSSELHPGGNPNFPTEKHVELLVGKIRNFLIWLTRTETIQGFTLSELDASETYLMIEV